MKNQNGNKINKKAIRVGVHKKYPYEIVPGHMVSPARYSFQRKVTAILPQYLTDNDKTVLDFGCGSGVWRFLFQGKKYTGIDVYDDNYMEKSNGNYQLKIADGRKLPFKDNSFDFVFSNAVLEHIVENKQAAKETFRVLKKGKYCVVIVPTNISPMYDEYPFLPLKVLGFEGHGDHYYSKKEICKLLEEAGFKVVHVSHSMGFYGALLKMFYVYFRLPRYLWQNMMFVLFEKKYPIRSLYSDSITWKSRNIAELHTIQKKEYKKQKNPLRRFYRGLQEIAYHLDQRSKKLGGEWCVVVKKE